MDANTTQIILVAIQYLAPVIGAALTALLRWLAPTTPAPLLPIIATGIGATAAGLGGAGPTTAVALGGSAVALREIVDQAKQAITRWRKPDRSTPAM